MLKGEPTAASARQDLRSSSVFPRIQEQAEAALLPILYPRRTDLTPHTAVRVPTLFPHRAEAPEPVIHPAPSVVEADHPLAADLQDLIQVEAHIHQDHLLPEAAVHHQALLPEAEDHN